MAYMKCSRNVYEKLKKSGIKLAPSLYGSYCGVLSKETDSSLLDSKRYPGRTKIGNGIVSSIRGFVVFDKASIVPCMDTSRVSTRVIVDQAYSQHHLSVHNNPIIK